VTLYYYCFAFTIVITMRRSASPSILQPSSLSFLSFCPGPTLLGSDFRHDLRSFPLILISCFYLLSSRFVLLLPLFILLTYSFLSSSTLLLCPPHVHPSFLISFALSSLPPCPPFFITSSPPPSTSHLCYSVQLLIRIHIARSTTSGYSMRAGADTTKPRNGEN
jgi:hypothetical protein